MGDLAKYIAEVVEFIVAGVLVLASLLILGYVVAGSEVEGWSARADELLVGSLGPLLGLAVVYALGIMAEGVSRVAFEWHLDRQTRTAIYSDFARRQSAETPVTTKQRRMAMMPFDRLPDDTSGYRGLREEWRMRVMGRSIPLASQIESQLKRLRIERASALAGTIAAVALGANLWKQSIGGGVMLRVTMFAFVLAIAVAAVLLSFERHKRYVGTIIRCNNELATIEPPR